MAWCACRPFALQEGLLANFKLGLLQARVLFHEAALLGQDHRSARQQISSKCLGDAYQHAITATRLAPSSASCAALRATLVLNLILEQCITANAHPPSGQASPVGRFADQLSATLKHCSAVAAAKCTGDEADVQIAAGGLRTNDPCCLVCTAFVETLSTVLV